MMMIMMIVIIIIVNDRVFWCVRVHYSFSKGILSNCPFTVFKEPSSSCLTLNVGLS